MLDKYSRVLLKVIKGKRLTREEISALLKEFNACLRKASENRIEFLFLKTIKTNYPKLYDMFHLRDIYLEGESKMADFHKAFSLFYSELDGINYALIKTCYPFPVTVSDIDMLFFEKEGYQSFVKRMKDKGFLYKEDDELKGSLEKLGVMKCEPHLDISWYGMRFVSKDFIKRNLIKKTVTQSTFFVPNNKATFVITAAHILFDCQYLSLRDYLVLKNLVNNKETVLACLAEAEKFGWGKGAVYMVDTIHMMRELEEKRTHDKKISFPFWIPLLSQCWFFKDKFIFDLRKKGKIHISLKNILLPFISYYWKKLRSKFSGRIYRNSWLY